jgi:hypothetical protein
MDFPFATLPRQANYRLVEWALISISLKSSMVHSVNSSALPKR